MKFFSYDENLSGLSKGIDMPKPGIDPLPSSESMNQDASTQAPDKGDAVAPKPNPMQGQESDKDNDREEPEEASGPGNAKDEKPGGVAWIQYIINMIKGPPSPEPKNSSRPSLANSPEDPAEKMANDPAMKNLPSDAEQQRKVNAPESAPEPAPSPRSMGPGA
jgi:hypothetical protein